MATQREPQPVFDRVPPQNLDAERSVLGAMLLDADAVGAAIEILHDQASEVFYSPAHQHIYSAMLKLFSTTTPVDAVTLLEQLNRDSHLEEAGGGAYISDLTGAVPTSANVEYYAHIVMDTAVLRRLITACSRLAGEAYDVPEDVSTLLDKVEAEIFSIAAKRQLTPIYKISELLEDTIHRVEKLIEAGSGITGIATGFPDLDEMTSGFQPSDMIVLAARPSVGKTAFALNLAYHAAKKDAKRVLLFSLEMSKEQLALRLVCMAGAINSRRLRSGFLAKPEFKKVQEAAGKLEPLSLFIDDTPNIGVLDIRSKARRHAAQHGLDLVIVDYLQLMSVSHRVENRQVEIAEISRSIKGIARELRVPVMALSQLSREAERDDTGTPKLSHLRESGAIEQDADVVMMLSRPPAHEREGNENLITLTLAKQRNGPTGKMKMLFDRDLQQFKSLAPGGRMAGPPSGNDAPPESDDEEPFDEDDAPF